MIKLWNWVSIPIPKVKVGQLIPNIFRSKNYANLDWNQSLFDISSKKTQVFEKLNRIWEIRVQIDKKWLWIGVLTSHCRLEHCSKMTRLETAWTFLARTRSSHEKFGLLTTLVMLLSHRTLEHCSSMLEKLAARKWLGSKPNEPWKFWLVNIPNFECLKWNKPLLKFTRI